MDRENSRDERKNLWEEKGHRGGLVESERGRRSSASKRDSRRAQGKKESYGSRYEQKGSGRTGSRYAQSENERSGSRYAQNENERRGSRYAQSKNGSVWSGSRYSQKRSETAATSSRRSECPKKQKQKGFDPVRFAFMSLGVVMVIAYVVVAIYFGRHFYSGSSIYGIDCSKKTADQVKAEVKEKIGEYVLTIETRSGRQDTISANQINLQYHDESGIEQQLKKQYCFVWPAMMLMSKSNDLVIGTTYDESSIDGVLKQLNCFLPGNVVPPQDAYRGDTDYGYEVVPEVMGTTLDYEKTKSVIMDALNRGAVTVSLEEEGCYIDPVIYQDNEELNAEVEELNALLTAHITYDFDDRQEVVDANVMKAWIRQDEEGAYYIEESCIWDYVAELAGKYDTFGCERIFYTTIGTVETLTGGDYGWCIDQVATGEILVDAVMNGKTQTLEPVYIYEGMDRKENDIGGTYVEICLSRQQMWCYENGYLMVDTPVVTGNPNKGAATPSGSVWAIDAKMTEYVLRGEGYEAPVDYWMPFNGDVGIHDMQNRYYFGGSIYLSNGSHGCVNTPYEAAQTIYNIVSIGTPVIVYE